MNPSSLHALIIDRHFGELSDEGCELLEHYLAENAGARAEAERIVESLSITQTVMLRHPELSRVRGGENPRFAVRRSLHMQWLARAAGVILFAGLAAMAGFTAGRSGSRVAKSELAGAPIAMSPAKPNNASPWARYRMAFDPTGSGVQVVRVDPVGAENSGPR